jgi:hypothetical protein
MYKFHTEIYFNKIFSKCKAALIGKTSPVIPYNSSSNELLECGLSTTTACLPQ